MSCATSKSKHASPPAHVHVWLFVSRDKDAIAGAKRPKAGHAVGIYIVNRNSSGAGLRPRVTSGEWL